MTKRSRELIDGDERADCLIVACLVISGCCSEGLIVVFPGNFHWNLTEPFPLVSKLI